MTEESARFAALFAGQGSQSVGMLGELAGDYPLVRQTFEEVGSATGLDLWKLASEGPEERLAATEITQPLVFAADLATWRLWRAEGGPQPAIAAGHSLGEFAALTAAGVLTFFAACVLIAARGRLMAAAVPGGVGGMAAIVGLGDDQVKDICQRERGHEVAEAVNFNAPGQVVISGHRSALERVAARAKEEGARLAVPLAVSVPNHSSLMESAAREFAELLAQTPLAEPQFPVVHNTWARTSRDLTECSAALKRHLTSAVYWRQSIEAMGGPAGGRFVEFGPGNVLSGLLKRIDRSAECWRMESPEAFLAARAALS